MRSAGRRGSLARVDLPLSILIGASIAAFILGCGGGPSATIRSDGSSTVFPVTEAAAEEFMALNRDVQVLVGASGTGGGFRRFCNGETAVQNASRPISEVEAATCAENGVEWVEVPVGLDGISVVTHPETDFVSCLTMEELETIWAPDAEREITRWSQVRDGLPDVELQLFGPGTDSGTFDFFTEAVAGDSGASRADYTASENDDTLVLGVSGTRGSLGYFGFAYYEENADQLRVLGVDGGEGCVEPSIETIREGTYPLSRPIFIYVNRDALRERPEVEAFVRYYLSPEGMALVAFVGYVPLSEAQQAASLERVEAALAGAGGA